MSKPADQCARDGQHYQQRRDGNLAAGQRRHVREGREVTHPPRQIQERSDLAGQEGCDEHGPRDRGRTAGEPVQGEARADQHPDGRQPDDRGQQIGPEDTPITALHGVGQTDTQPAGQHQDSGADHGHDEVTERPAHPAGGGAQDQIGAHG